MSARQARSLLQSAFAAGIEWAGINMEAGRPMVGCDPRDEQACELLTKLLAACATDWEAMNCALWRHALNIDVEDAPGAQRALVVTLGSKETMH